jgi:hypothetical protein
MIEDVYRHSNLEDAASFIEENFSTLFEEALGRKSGRAELSSLKFSQLRLFKSVGVSAFLQWNALKITPEEIMGLLAACKIYVTRPVHRNMKGTHVLVLDDEWGALAMHLRLLGVLDGTYDLND